MSVLAHILRMLILVYRYTFSAFLGTSCRFRPTCSEYALDSVAAHGAIRGGWLAIKRICRCHPWGSCGYDPVPNRTGRKAVSGLTSNRSDTSV